MERKRDYKEGSREDWTERRRGTVLKARGQTERRDRRNEEKRGREKVVYKRTMKVVDGWKGGVSKSLTVSSFVF